MSGFPESCRTAAGSNGRHLLLTASGFTPQASPEEEYLLSDSEQQVFRMCDSLKSPYREIAISHFCKQMSVAEISQKEGKNPKTVQTQLYRAKSMLKKLLAERSD